MSDKVALELKLPVSRFIVDHKVVDILFDSLLLLRTLVSITIIWCNSGLGRLPWRLWPHEAVAAQLAMGQSIEFIDYFELWLHNSSYLSFLCIA